MKTEMELEMTASCGLAPTRC
eukprot:SAG11_NODE_37451_length_256_cov_35.585987_1_plen_20_part_10